MTSSGFARVAHHQAWQVFYKEFLPRSPAESLKALLKGSRATRARKNSEALLQAGFNAPANIVWGQLPRAREYLFTQTVPGVGVRALIKSHASKADGLSLLEWRELLRQLGMFIGRLHATGFIHGDLRSSNVLAHRSALRFEFSLIDNERNSYGKPAPGKLLLKNLMQLNMHGLNELSRTDRLRFFHAWHSQMKDLSELEAGIIARQSFAWAMKRLGTKGKL